MSNIRHVSDAPVVLHSPGGVPLDRYRRRLPFVPAHGRAQRELLRVLDGGVRELAAGSVNALVLDESEVIRRIGGARAAGRRAFDDVPDGYFHALRLGPALADEYDGILRDHALLGRAKAVFVDFDDTLWRGVMAEGEVVHDRELQRLLRRLTEAGVILVALSKNDASSIRWDEMELSPDDFALLKIGWRPKADTASEAIRELDLAASAFVLLDDNPVERALVSETVAGVAAVDPADPTTPRALERWLAFPSTSQTEEARNRTRMYREAASRRAATSGSHDYEAMMASLGLVAEIRDAGVADVPRLLELVQRTNQFNTTTVRRSAAEVAELVGHPALTTITASLRDRFGDLGVVAVAIVDNEIRHVDSFIMSCRAMGFGLETALVAAVADRLGEGPITADFVPTDRNGPAARLWPSHGFVDVGAGRWRLEAEAPRPTAPAWIRRIV